MKRLQNKRPQGFLTLFLLAEMLKLFIFAVFFVGAVERFQLHAFPTLLGFLVNLVLYWVLCLTALGDR